MSSQSKKTRSTRKKRFNTLFLQALGVFLVILIILECGFGYFFVEKIAALIEDNRKKEFTLSWKKFLAQRKLVYESKITGYAWWTEMARAVEKNDIAALLDFVGTDTTLRKEYDIYEVVDKNFVLLFSIIEGNASLNNLGEENNLLGMEDIEKRKKFFLLTSKKYTEFYPKYRRMLKQKTKTDIDKIIIWHDLTRYRGEVRLLSVSPVCENGGYPYTKGFYLFGYKVENILKLAQQIIPAEITISQKKPPGSYLSIKEEGFSLLENYYINLEPHIIIADIARSALFVFIILQTILSVALFSIISPAFTRKYTRNLREVIQQRTEQLHQDLEIARKVQECIIRTIPPTPDLEVDSQYMAMKSVGGDVYDIRRIGKSAYSFMIADVSGHGVAAALITTMAKTSFINHSSISRTPLEVCTRVNADIFSLIGDMDHYLTAFYGIFDMDTLTLSYTDCGHLPPFIYRAGSGTIEEMLSDSGFPIGIIGTPHFVNKKIKLQVDDMLFLYTDGITEARDSDDGFYTTERLHAFVKLHGTRAPKDLLAGLVSDLNKFCDSREQSDDRAIVLIKILKEQDDTEPDSTEVSIYTMEDIEPLTPQE
ncbi:MAG: serine/threonine-protein phosphatase [bacterium]|nr:serine/threonine-protein phosphatase [bacterium]